ncbi:hypothetical protein BJ944DRAFT_7078 [Cunninghamella echinulata]|nr:hypothetical protein BJ944DRAFT_7078 [Cunninghamella echinulata]
MTEEDRHYIRYNDHTEGDINGGGPIRRGNRHHRSGDNHGGAPYRPRRDDPRNEEKQCRTLFVRNIQFDTKEDEILKVFSPYGDIKEIFNRMETRGIVFVHYYDLRSAERAKRDCENIMIGGRNLDIHYSVPKDDIRVVKCDRTKNQGTLLLSLNGSQSALVDSELYDYFKQFGDIKVIRTPTFKTSSENTERWQRFVEFYDSRAAVAAADATHGKSYKNGKWDVTYFWDQGPRERRDVSPSRRGDRTRRSDPRSNRHDRDRYDDHHRRGRHTSPPPRHSSSSHWNPPPSSMPAPTPLPVPTSNSIIDQSQLEKSQKAQQLLTLLSQLQSGQSQVPAPAPAPVPAPSSIYSQPVANNLPISGPPSLSAAPTGPPPQNQNQIQQLLGILVK